MKIKLLKLFLISIIFFNVVSFASAANYYVRPDGSDSASGLENNSDDLNGGWLTLQKASNSVSSGDIVNVADGNYAGFYVENAGTFNFPIVFKAIDTGANIISRNSRTPDGINIESYNEMPANYITIDGFNVYGQERIGIRAIGGTGIIIKNNTLHNNLEHGILSGDTPSIQILDNIAYENGSSPYDHNIYVSNAESDDTIIRGNIAYSSNFGNGIQINGDIFSGGDGFIDNALIENNTVYNNAAKGFSIISVRYSRIQNNVIYSNKRTGAGAGGIHIVDEPDSNCYSSENVIVNNTIDEQNMACIRINDLNVENIVFNNICLGSTGIVFEGNGNYADNNSNYSIGFFDYANHDYRLTLNSSGLINTGSSAYLSKAAPSKDKIGIVRSQNGNYDIGAYEFQENIDQTQPSSPTGLSVI